MSSEQENGTRFDVSEHDLVVVVSKLAPERGADWTEDVRVFINGRESSFFSFELILDGSLRAPVVMMNRVMDDEDS